MLCKRKELFSAEYLQNLVLGLIATDPFYDQGIRWDGL